MRVAGATPGEIAEQLNVERRTVYVWFSNPLVKDGLQRELGSVNEEFRLRLALLGLDAIDTLHKLMALPGPGNISAEAKLDAIRAAIEISPLTRIPPAPVCARRKR